MYKAILVDDEKIVRLALKTIVDWTALGYTVTGSYSSVKTALLEIEDDPPDLIITDIKMPDMDGLQFIQQVRQQNRECEIIVLTNHENFSYAVEAIRLGVMDYVVKTDISPESLSTLLQKAAERLAGKKGAEPVPVTPMTEDDFREMQRVRRWRRFAFRSPMRFVWPFWIARRTKISGMILDSITYCVKSWGDRLPH